MWPRNDLLDLLGITVPIVQAPMSGFTPPPLAAAVSNAGGLGSLGCGSLPIAAIREQIAATRQATDRPFNVNLFVHRAPAAAAEAIGRMRALLAPYFAEFGLGNVPEVSDPLPTFDRARLDLLLELKPRVVSFHFGAPETAVMHAIKQSGALTLSSATTVAEARHLESAGIDAIVAQGYEAGGHRGTFSDGAAAGMIGTLALVPQVVDAVRVPVIAAGAIADARGIAAAFALGASGVQMGTAFLACPEASVPPAYLAALRAASDESTQLTRLFTGRPARALRNRLVAELAAAEEDALPFPMQASLLAPLWRAPSDAARAAATPFWAGQAAALAREMPAGELVSNLAAEARALLRC